MNNKDKTIIVLNNLIQINNDRLDGYQHAFEETDEYDLKEIFQVFSETSRKCNDELTEQVSKLGGLPQRGPRHLENFLEYGWM